MVIISLHHFHLLLMSNANNQYERTGLDELLDSIVDIYANENRHQPQRQQTNRYPLSFNIQPPRTTPTPTPTPAPTPRPTMNNFPIIYPLYMLCVIYLHNITIIFVIIIRISGKFYKWLVIYAEISICVGVETTIHANQLYLDHQVLGSHMTPLYCKSAPHSDYRDKVRLPVLQ